MIFYWCGYSCNSGSCSTECPFSTGYYPDLKNPHGYCYCSGDKNVPSRYDSCTYGTQWSMTCRGAFNLFIEQTYGVYGSDGGCCDYGSNDNNYIVASPSSGSDSDSGSDSGSNSGSSS